jgi:hypothetical protein
MSDMIFSVKEGFRDVTPEDKVPEPEDGPWAEWLVKVKFKRLEHVSTHTDMADEPAFELYEREEGPWRFLVMMNDSSSSQAVYMKEFAALIELRFRLVAQACAERTAYLLTDLHRMADIMFKVTHGHSFEGICRKCDPEGYEKMLEPRRLREEKKRTAANPQQA